MTYPGLNYVSVEDYEDNALCLNFDASCLPHTQTSSDGTVEVIVSIELLRAALEQAEEALADYEHEEDL